MKSSPFSKAIPTLTGILAGLALLSAFILSGNGDGWGSWVLPPILAGFVTYLMSMEDE